MKQSELKDILDQHRLWLESGQKQGKRANLRGANLRGAILRGAYLQGAKFTTNFKKVGWFDRATFSEDQIPWACLHPKFGRWESTLKWVRLLPTQRDIS
jgi:hypothetical protein